MKEAKVDDSFEKQDVKTEKITESQIDEMAKLAGSFEALFSRTARKYRQLDLKSKQLVESDYKKLILEEYTFLKRPVFIIEDKIFVGNAKKTIQLLINILH
jgi:arsenate reductase